MCHEQWALTVTKLLRFFGINICCFLPDAIRFCTTVVQSSKLHQRFCSRGVAWTLPHKSRPNRSHRKRSYSISNIWEHDGMRLPQLCPSRSLCRRVMAFRILFNNSRPPFWILNFNIWLLDCHCCRICCCMPNLVEIGSRVRPPDAHNCGMFNAPLLGNGRCCGNRIMADMSGTWWDVNTHVVSQSVRCRRVMVFRIFSNMAAVRHFKF